jgi:putative FmdB family regulatory protein
LPIYEYRCADCGATFEKLLHRSGDAAELACPNCGERHLEQQLSTFAAHSSGTPGGKDLPMCPGGGVCRTPGACGLN